MGEEKLKINDIAIITGVPEDRIRKMVDENPDKFRYSEINKVKVFGRSAVDTVLRLSRQGAGGDHPYKPIITEEKSPLIQDRRKPPSVSSIKAAAMPVEVYTDMKGLQDNAARHKRSIDSLRRDIAEKERQIEGLHENVYREISYLHQLIESQQAQLDSISQWIDYFEKLTDEMRLSAAERFMRGLRGDYQTE